MERIEVACARLREESEREDKTLLGILPSTVLEQNCVFHMWTDGPLTPFDVMCQRLNARSVSVSKGHMLPSARGINIGIATHGG